MCRSLGLNSTGLIQSHIWKNNNKIFSHKFHEECEYENEHNVKSSLNELVHHIHNSLLVKLEAACRNQD